ncbi:hypothetical protein [Micromonospora fulviviridis]|uniref:hypothetical protein n=1 Tax=Micromonospora fulviviridis TaxID=47860 RepID=UPI00166D36C7|nr:hypothetical protein [Micromonospora fulviviridis]
MSASFSSGAVVSGAVIPGDLISGALTSGALTSGALVSGALVSGAAGAVGIAISGVAGASGAVVDFRAAEVAFFAGAAFFAAGARRGRFGASSITGWSITGSLSAAMARRGEPAGVPGSALPAATSADGRGRGAAGTSAAGGVACAGSGGWKRTVGAAFARLGRGGVSPATSAGAGSGAGGGVKVGLAERLRRAWTAGSRRGGSLGGCSCISMERRPERDVAHDENAGDGPFPVVALLRVGTDLYPRARWSPGHQGDFA